MHLRRTCLLLTLGLLGACQSPAVRLPAAAHDAVASTAPTHAPTPVAPATTTKPLAPPPLANALVRLPGGRSLSGVISLDPDYIQRATGGGVVSVAGSPVLAAGATRLNGSSLVDQTNVTIAAASGGNVVVPASIISQDGNGIISQDGNGIISQDGNGIISQDGNGIVAQGGGNIVAQGGGNIVAQGGGNYHVSAAGAAQGGGNIGQTTPTAGYHVLQAATTVGQLVPAAGMAVYVRSLATGKPIQLGTDGANKPAYAIYSDLAGHYQVSLPPDQTGTVEVVALVLNQQDPRMRFARLAAPSITTLSLDDDSATAERYVRQAFKATIMSAVRGETIDDSDSLLGPVVLAKFKQLSALARSSGISEASLAQQDAYGERATDLVFTKAKPALDVLVLPADAGGSDNAFVLPDLHAYAILGDFLRYERVALAQILYGPQQASLVPADAFASLTVRFGGPAEPYNKPYTITSPDDFGLFVSNYMLPAYFDDPLELTNKITEFQQGLGIGSEAGAKPWFQATVLAIQATLLQTLGDPAGPMQALIDLESTRPDSPDAPQALVPAATGAATPAIAATRALSKP